MNTTIMPVVSGGLGLVKNRMENDIGKITGNIKIQQVQKCVLLGTAHIQRWSLSIK